MLQRFYIICMLATLSLTLALTGCGNGPKGTVTDVKLGMTKAEALEILGPPQDRTSKTLGNLTEEELRWRSGNRTVVLTLTGNRVSGKQIIGPAVKAQDS